MSPNVIWFSDIGIKDIGIVGGKNASLGEMIQHLTKVDVKVPNGFATTAKAYRKFLEHNNLTAKIKTALVNLNVNDIKTLEKTGKKIRELIVNAEFLPDFIEDISAAHKKLGTKSVAVRSSATAEDLPEASFAGQQETYLNVEGVENVLTAVKKVFASLYTDRAIIYRINNNYPHESVALSVGIQKMIRSDKSCSGVMFTLDTESGFDKVVFINAAFGLGELVVQGEVNPDEFYVYKPNLVKNLPAILRRNVGEKAIKMIFSTSQQVTKIPVPENERKCLSLTDNEVEVLARHAVSIENHYQKPMDIEWAKDGEDGELYIVQARPETVESQHKIQTIDRYKLEAGKKKNHHPNHLLQEVGEGSIIISGRSVGQKIGQGKAKIILNLKDMDKLKKGDVLVTDMTDPDWEPVMKRAAAIVTNRGGRTCHAAIVARELGIPAVVGTNNGTELIKDDMEITVSCAEGDDGFVYRGLLPFSIDKTSVDKMPELPFKIMLNLANPDMAFSVQNLPNSGVGLLRLEFIIAQMIGIHPKALLNYAKLSKELQNQIGEKIINYKSPTEYYIERLKEGVATIAAAFYPKQVIVRFSDFKSNEYANLLGGKDFEPSEENPMIGFRGAGRYVDDLFRDCFQLECAAIKRIRNEMGFTNIEVMIPFVRTVSELKAVLEILALNGLEHGKNDLKIIMMCEIPSNAILAESFLEYCDGFSIGSNDLTQLTLGIDRDSALVAKSFDERDLAVKELMHLAIQTCKHKNKYIGICGQGPSDHPDLAKWLMQEGIESISLNPDSVVETWFNLSKK